jgi:hypothetical protein
MTVRRKPSNQLRATTREASDEDYKILAAAVVEAITLKRKDVHIRFPYFVSLPEDFPKGILYKKDELYNYFRCKSFKLMDWLYNHGHAAQDAKGVVKSLRCVNNFIGEIDRMLVSPEKIVYNDVSVIKEDV